MTAAESITIVRSRSRRLAKVIHADGRIDPYDQVKTVDLIEHPIADLGALYQTLAELALRADCAVIRGKPADPTHRRSLRRLLYPDRETGEVATIVETARRWVALDVDDLPCPRWIECDDLLACACVAISKLPIEFRQATFLVQATSSHGLKPGIRIRLWAWLSRPIAGAELKCWLRRAPVDRSIFGPAQLTYTASPVFLAGAFDPLPHRIDVIPGQGEVRVPSSEQLTPPDRPRYRRASEPTGNIDGLVRVVETAKRGNRNAALYWAARRVAEHSDIDQDAAARELEAAGCRIGMPAKEVEATVASALRGGSS